MPTFVVRHLPQFALGSMALLAALGVTLVYVNREPTGAIGSGDSKLLRTPENAAPRTLPRDLPPAVARALAEPGPADLPPATVATLVETVVPADESSREHEMAVMPAALKLDSARPASPPVIAPARTSESKSPAPVAETHAPAPPPATNASPVAVNTPAAPEFRPAPLRPDQLNGLVASLAEQYQRGDLENLLGLFDASAHIESGDKKQIRAEYGELFRNSENRTLYIWDVTWSGDGKVTRGKGSFQAQVQHKGDGSKRIYNGALTIEVIQRNDRPLIVGLYQKAER